MDGYLSGWVAGAMLGGWVAGAKLGGWVDGYLSGWVAGVIWISLIQINSKKLHIWDPQSVKVYRKSGRVNYPQKIWD